LSVQEEPTKLGEKTALQNFLLGKKKEVSPPADRKTGKKKKTFPTTKTFPNQQNWKKVRKEGYRQGMGISNKKDNNNGGGKDRFRRLVGLLTCQKK